MLEFSAVLNELPFTLAGEDGVKRNYKLRELTGDQRAKYDASFDIKIEVDAQGGVKGIPGEGFKSFSGKDFLALCLYDDNNTLVSAEFIGALPSKVVNALHTEALKLSGLDKKAMEAAKNESEGSEEAGTE